MKMIQIRNVPDELHQALKIRAIREGVTMSELIHRELPGIASRPSIEEIMQRAGRRKPVKDIGPIPDLLREERAKRDARY
jgi:hypothetical protein